MNAKLPKTQATVLVVDDEPRNIKLHETLLHAEGCATIAAGNGSEALALTTAQNPNLILLDVMMPDMDGFETVARLKADPRTRPVPVIMRICDVYDALRSKRPYKPPIDHLRSVEIITKGDDRVQPEHFDPAVLACFAGQADRFAAICDAHVDT